jgi:hypothetical protein
VVVYHISSVATTIKKLFFRLFMRYISPQNKPDLEIPVYPSPCVMLILQAGQAVRQQLNAAARKEVVRYDGERIRNTDQEDKRPAKKHGAAGAVF